MEKISMKEFKNRMARGTDFWQMNDCYKLVWQTDFDYNVYITGYDTTMRKAFEWQLPKTAIKLMMNSEIQAHESRMAMNAIMQHMEEYEHESNEFIEWLLLTYKHRNDLTIAESYEAYRNSPDGLTSEFKAR